MNRYRAFLMCPVHITYILIVCICLDLPLKKCPDSYMYRTICLRFLLALSPYIPHQQLPQSRHRRGIRIHFYTAQKDKRKACRSDIHLITNCGKPRHDHRHNKEASALVFTQTARPTTHRGERRVAIRRHCGIKPKRGP